MSEFSDYKTLDYLNLKNPENYNLCKRSTLDKNKLICSFRENFGHKLHSNSNDSNFEQLNTLIDLICCLSKNVKINLNKLNKPSDFYNKTNTSENIVYLKKLLEDIFKNTKEESKIQLETIKSVEKELIKNNKLLENVLYGKQRT